MGNTRTALVCAVTLAILLSINAADAIHIFSGVHKPRYNKTNEVSVNRPEVRLRELYKEYLRKQQRTGGKARRFVRHSADGLANDQEIPDSFFEKLRILPMKMTRARNPKRNQESKATPYINKDAYLSLCHFKICNMGRKRSIRSNALHERHQRHQPH